MTEADALSEIAADDLDFVRFVERVASIRLPANVELQLRPTLYRREREPAPSLGHVNDELIALLDRLAAIQLPPNMGMTITIHFFRRSPSP
jgi:hypothetical protein